MAVFMSPSFNLKATFKVDITFLKKQYSVSSNFRDPLSN